MIENSKKSGNKPGRHCSSPWNIFLKDFRQKSISKIVMPFFDIQSVFGSYFQEQSLRHGGIVDENSSQKIEKKIETKLDSIVRPHGIFSSKAFIRKIYPK